MLLVSLALQVVGLLLLLALLWRRPAAPPGVDPVVLRGVLEGIPERLARWEERSDALERHLRAELALLRQEAAERGARSEERTEKSGETLRRELAHAIQVLDTTLKGDLGTARSETLAESERLRGALEAHSHHVRRQFSDFAAEANRQQHTSRETLYQHLDGLSRQQGTHHEQLRGAVETKLEKLNAANELKLEEMRQTVDEKLHATLQNRLTESFGAVTDQLTKVHSGLGEMSKLSSGVEDLSRIFTNVKSRGGFAEVQLGMLLAQMLAPGQFSQNVKVKPNTGELVEYAVKLPTPQGEVLLPIDAKFPRESWERLESAYAHGTPAELAAAGRAFEQAIRTEGRRICEKYIVQPVTTNFAIMFLPTEGLYAEVMRRDGLQADIQQNCRVTIAGPSTLSAILNSFQMGFHMLEMQQKGDEVWKVLASARVQFGKFESLMTKMDEQVSRVQKTIQEVGTRTRVINRTLRDVSLEDEAQDGGERSLSGKQGFDGYVPVLAAMDEG